MEIKCPFSWTSFRSPSEVKGDGDWRGPRATLQASLPLHLALRPWFLSPPSLSPAQEEALLTGLWPVLSHQRGLRAVAGGRRAVPAGKEQPSLCLLRACQEPWLLTTSSCCTQLS